MEPYVYRTQVISNQRIRSSNRVFNWSVCPALRQCLENGECEFFRCKYCSWFQAFWSDEIIDIWNWYWATSNGSRMEFTAIYGERRAHCTAYLCDTLIIVFFLSFFKSVLSSSSFQCLLALFGNMQKIQIFINTNFKWTKTQQQKRNNTLNIEIEKNTSTKQSSVLLCMFHGNSIHSHIFANKKQLFFSLPLRSHLSLVFISISFEMNWKIIKERKILQIAQTFWVSLLRIFFIVFSFSWLYFQAFFKNCFDFYFIFPGRSIS